VRKESGKRESTVSSERPCLATRWQHQRGRHGHLGDTHETPDDNRSFGAECLKINVRQWLPDGRIIYSRNIGAHSECDDDQDDCAEDPSTANGTHYGVSDLSASVIQTGHVRPSISRTLQTHGTAKAALLASSDIETAQSKLQIVHTGARKLRINANPDGHPVKLAQPPKVNCAVLS
jgi:hypothetical protein